MKCSEVGTLGHGDANTRYPPACHFWVLFVLEDLKSTFLDGSNKEAYAVLEDTIERLERIL